MQRAIFCLAPLLAFTIASTAEAKLTGQEKCDSQKLLAAAKFAQCRLKADFLEAKKPDKFDQVAAYIKCGDKFEETYSKLHEKYPVTEPAIEDKCSVFDDAAAVRAFLEAAGDSVTDGTAAGDCSAENALYCDLDDASAYPDCIYPTHCEAMGGSAAGTSYCYMDAFTAYWTPPFPPGVPDYDHRYRLDLCN